MKLNRQTYSNQVVQYIRTLIQDYKLKPGDALIESTLAKDLGISRAPIREAFQVLIYDGLIIAEPQKGKRVRVLTAKEIQESYFVGGILEGAAVATTLAQWTDNDMLKLQKTIQRIQEECTKAKSVVELVDLDDQFHEILLMYCRNEKLFEIAKNCCVNISKFLCYRQWLNLYTPMEFYQRHAVIAEAVLQRDSLKTEHLLREHYKETGSRLSETNLDG